MGEDSTLHQDAEDRFPVNTVLMHKLGDPPQWPPPALGRCPVSRIVGLEKSQEASPLKGSYFLSDLELLVPGVEGGYLGRICFS